MKLTAIDSIARNVKFSLKLKTFDFCEKFSFVCCIKFIKVIY